MATSTARASPRCAISNPVVTLLRLRSESDGTMIFVRATTGGIALLTLAAIAGTASAVPYKIKTLQSFCADAPACSNGVNPQSSLVLDSARNLYGTTLSGGTGFGTVFE